MDGGKAQIYLDHNALSYLVDQDETITKIIDSFSANPACQFIYSDENLKEIHKSKDFENIFLELLKKLKAKHLVPEIDSTNQPTDNYFLHDVDPFDYYKVFLKNQNEYRKTERMLSGYMEKIYGGAKDKPYSDMVTEGIAELQGKFIQCTQEIDFKQNDLLREHADYLTKELNKISNYEFVQDIDSNKTNGIPVKNIESQLGIDIVELNNITYPKVLVKIWELIKKSLPQSVSFETFFCIDPKIHFPDIENPTLSMIQKITILYSALNLYGYFRDKQLQKGREFNAFLSDMSHASMGYFADVIMSTDKRFVMKTIAVYEYLEITKTIIHVILEDKQIYTYKLSTHPLEDERK